MRSLLRFHDELTQASSTELRDLVDGKHLDVATLAAYLCQAAPIEPGRTLYRGIRSELLPDVWRAAPDVPMTFEGRPRDERAACDRVREVLTFVVDRLVGTAKRVAVLASGGIDSSVVMALAAEAVARRGGSVVAIAIDFASPGDDRPHLRALEAHLKCEVIRVTPRDGADYLEPLREGIDAAPMLWAFSPVQLALYAAARESGAEVVLTGVGGDDFFDGHPRSLSELAKRHPLEAIRKVRALEGFWTPRFPIVEHLLRPLAVPFVPSFVRRLKARRQPSMAEIMPWAGPTLRETSEELTKQSRELALRGALSERSDAYFQLPSQHYYAWLVHQEQRAVLVDRREPLFTEEVAAAVATIPPHLLLAGERRRGLLRESMRGRLPDSLLDRPDKAEFSPAFRPFFEAAGGADAFEQELEGRALGRLGLVEPKTFRDEMTKAFAAPEQSGMYGLAWAALAAEAFLCRRPELA
ncbi:MAG: asparagine synthase [Labilithrix sp.]|nr:asparagine synthase [Labilithrix sp.]